MSNTIEGKSIVVTGGASGLGAAICRVLARERARIVVADINDEAAGRVAREVEAAGAEASALVADIGTPAGAQRLVDHANDRFGGIDVLINNAGTDVTAPADEISIEQWQRVLSTNLSAPFMLSRLVIPAMRTRGGGQIVNVCSTAARRAWPNASVYHATKWGLLGLSHALHAELRPANIRVTAVIAGGMRTPFLLDRFPDIDVTKLQDPATVAETIRFVIGLTPESAIPEIMVLPRLETSWP